MLTESASGNCTSSNLHNTAGVICDPYYFDLQKTASQLVEMSTLLRLSKYVLIGQHRAALIIPRILVSGSLLSARLGTPNQYLPTLIDRRHCNLSLRTDRQHSSNCCRHI